MTREEKIEALDDFCYDAQCPNCPLNDCDCDYDEDVSDFRVDELYEIVFGKTETTKDNVNHPTHYETGKFECIDVMIETQGIEAVKHFCMCNAFKYIYRHGNKNGIEDVKKAIWYLNKYIELTEGGHE
jgi:hypothetical protein